MLLCEVQDPLFRGKRETDNEWIYGYHVKTEDGSYIHHDGSIDKIDSKTLGIYAGTGYYHGREANIYSGDIVISSTTLDYAGICIYELGVIECPASSHDLTAMLCVTPGHYTDMPFMINIVGNIYDLDCDINKDLKTLESKTEWLKKNLKGKNSRNLMKYWNDSSYTKEELSLIYKYQKMAEKEHDELLQLSRSKDTKDLLVDLKIRNLVTSKYREKINAEIQKSKAKKYA